MKKRQLRGFAALDEDERRAIASVGGGAVFVQSTAHEVPPEGTQEAGRNGGRERN